MTGFNKVLTTSAAELDVGFHQHSQLNLMSDFIDIRS